MLWVACGIIPVAVPVENQTPGFKLFVYLLFLVSGIVNGFGAAVIWVGQGAYVANTAPDDS